jgi:hypothetical protein
MFEYFQTSGRLFHNGRSISRGYSGKGRGKNNPALQGLRGIGPIPQGDWRMVGIRNHPQLGPLCITVFALDEPTPDDWHEETGRGLFRIHGDSIRQPGNASSGCIIMPRDIRAYMWRHKADIVRVLP